MSIVYIIVYKSETQKSSRITMTACINWR